MTLRSTPGRLAAPLAALTLMLATLPACRGRAGAPGTSGALGDYALDERTVSLHLRAEVGLDPAEIDPAARVRLEEDLLDETLLAVGAEEAKLVPTPAALGVERERLAAALGTTATPKELDLAARRHVMAQLYEQTVLWPKVEVDPAQIERAVEQATAAGAASAEPPGGVVVFRQVRTEDRGAADRAFRRLTRGESFESVAAELSRSPDRGRPLQRVLRELPTVAADALRRLPEGGVARPIALDGAYYVFQLDARSGPPTGARTGADPGHGPAEPGFDDARADAGSAVDRREVAQRLRQEALDALREKAVAELARRHGVTRPAGTKGD